MITHKEAEILTSARQDEPLDPVVERELQAHLATCEQCRAFAIATERLTAGIKAMPGIPANPRTRREVMERVQRGRNPIAGLFGGIGGGFQSGPVLAAAATLVIIGLFGWLALDRLVLEDGGGNDNQIAAVPTEEPVDLTVVSPTMVAPTETVAPTEAQAPEPTATTPPEPTATTPPEPTATTPPEPTATTPPEPTATTPPEPTATTPPEPTATTPPEPTATTAPTEVPVEQDEGEPTDLTTLSAPSESDEPTATVAPTATIAPTAEPTAVPTEEPTEEVLQTTVIEETAVPTATMVPEPTATTPPEPTATTPPEPTATTPPEPTATTPPEPTSTPGIEPMEGMEVIESDGTGAADPTMLPEGTGSGPTESDNAPIEPTGDGLATETTAEEPATQDEDTSTGSGAEDLGTSAIEPLDGSGMGGNEPDTESAAIGPDGEATQEPVELIEGQSLAASSVPYTNIDGDPSGHLGLTPNGRLEFMQVVDGASRTTYDGFRLETGESQPSVLNLCGDGFCEPSMETPESETWQGDVPLGVVGETAYFMRLHSDGTGIYAATASGTSLLEPQLLLELGPTPAPATVYVNNGTLYTWLATGQWLEINGRSADVYSGSYGDPYNVRFAPLANVGPLIGYFSGGTLVIAPVTAPDSPVLTLPADGVDFDLTGGGTRVAVIQSNSIVIYDMDGKQLQVFSGGNIQPGSVIWLNSGIVYVDRNTGQLYQIPETAP